MRSWIALFLTFLGCIVSAAEQPNILYILCDDLGYGDLQCLNADGKIPTPNFDRLAAGGMIFTDVHSGSAVCTPTRYGVLTGRYAWRTPLQRGVLGGLSPRLIEEGRLTAASLLKQPGKYRLAVRMRSRAEPIYFMKFVGATREMEQAMNEWMLDIHPYTVEFELK